MMHHRSLFFPKQPPLLSTEKVLKIGIQIFRFFMHTILDVSWFALFGKYLSKWLYGHVYESEHPKNIVHIHNLNNINSCFTVNVKLVLIFKYGFNLFHALWCKSRLWLKSYSCELPYFYIFMMIWGLKLCPHYQLASCVIAAEIPL